MWLSRVEITNFRNLAAVQLDLGCGFNVLFGENGAGKTSFLEAIYYLGMGGRSFRSSIARSVIAHESEQLTVFGMAQNKNRGSIALGVERQRGSQLSMRIAGETIATRAELVDLLPLQLIDAHGYQLLESGPKHRREFMDWAMFHVEPEFLQVWRQSQRATKQRNAALRAGDRSQVELWGMEVAKAGVDLHVLRERYVEQFSREFIKMCSELLECDVSIEYFPGWDVAQNLQDVLEQHLRRDMQTGYTTVGPHKADLRFKADKVLAQEVLSRGQQKLMIFAARIAQGLLLRQQMDKSCIYLIDDLPSELDSVKQQYVVDLLRGMSAQVFVTGIHRSEVEKLFNAADEVCLFHVERGIISNC